MAQLQITSGGKDYVSKASELLAKAFITDPTFNWICSSLSKQERLEYFPTCFKILLNAATLNHSTIDEVGDFQSCGVLVPPGHHPLKPVTETVTMVRSGMQNMLWTLRWGGYQRLMSISHPARDLKNATFPNGETYYYIFFFGTLPLARGQGMCSKIIKHYQAIAAKAKKPIWLEAADEYCMGLYRSHGFVVVQEMKIAVGKSDRFGEMAEGGEGFSIWGMIWRPSAEEAAEEN